MPRPPRNRREIIEFVKTKFKLDEIERGKLPEIILEGDPIRSVPRVSKRKAMWCHAQKDWLMEHTAFG